MTLSFFHHFGRYRLLSVWNHDFFLEELFFTHEQQTLVPLPSAVFSLDQALAQYFSGVKKDLVFNNFKLLGTPFRQKVWQALRNLPYGETISYQALAATIGQPTAARAVAQAVAHNRLALIIPCHRVIRQDGSLGGFAWGLSLKQALLDLEKQF